MMNIHIVFDSAKPSQDSESLRVASRREYQTGMSHRFKGPLWPNKAAMAEEEEERARKRRSETRDKSSFV